MEIASYIIINLFLFSSWYIFLFRKKQCLSFSDRLLGTFILSLTQIIVTEMLLGVLFKKLFALPLFLFNISISFIVITLSITSSRRNLNSKGYNNTKSIFLKDIFIEFKEETIRILSILKREVLLLCVFCLFCISVLWMVFTGYLFPSYTWDALWYHLPIVGYIIQSGAIQENATPSMIDLFINIFPKNIELFFIWNTIFLKSDVIVDLSQLPFTIMGVLAIYGLSRKLGIKEKYALYSSFLFFFTPIIILQSTTNYVDIAISVLFLIALNFLMYDMSATYPVNSAGEINLKKRGIAVVLSGLTTGILLGSKGSGPLFVIMLLAGITIKEFIIIFNPFKLFNNFASTLKQKIKIMTRSVLFYLICYMIPAFVIGSYWYIKNWILYNNPVYPMEVSFFEITLFKGLYREIIESGAESLKNVPLLSRMLYVWLERVEYYLYDSRLSGFGPLWFILLLPSIIVAIFYALKEKCFNFFFAGIVLGITFLLYPNNWNTRYVIFIVGLGCLSFGLTLKYFEKRQNALKLVALILVIYTLLASNSPCIMPLKIKEFLSLPPKDRIIARHAPFNIDLQARQAYGLWIWINDNMQADHILAYTFEPLFLSPLWNRGFSNKITYIKSENFNEWIENLKKNGVTHILIKKNSIEDTWINKVKKLMYWSASSLGIQERFKIVYSDVNFKVVRFQ